MLFFQRINTLSTAFSVQESVVVLAGRTQPAFVLRLGLRRKSPPRDTLLLKLAILLADGRTGSQESREPGNRQERLNPDPKMRHILLFGSGAYVRFPVCKVKAEEKSKANSGKCNSGRQGDRRRYFQSFLGNQNVSHCHG